MAEAESAQCLGSGSEVSIRPELEALLLPSASVWPGREPWGAYDDSAASNGYRED